MPDNYIITGKIKSYKDFFTYSTFMRRGLELFYIQNRPSGHPHLKATTTLDNINELLAYNLAPHILSLDDCALYERHSAAVNNKDLAGSGLSENQINMARKITNDLMDIIATTDLSKIPSQVLELEVSDDNVYILEETIAIAMKYLGEHLKKTDYVKKKC